MESIKIYSQIWAKNNLATDYYTNGDRIPYVSSAEEWRLYSFNKIGCCCFYNYDAQNEKYGKLYNWYAVNDSRGVAPIGWRVPSDNDWEVLVENLGGSMVAGNLLKDNSFQAIHNEQSFGFNALASGYNGNSRSQLLGYNAHFWTSSEYLTDYAWLRFITHINNFVGRSFDYKSSGFALRLIKEEG